MLNLADALQQAGALYRAGEWGAAEKLCTSILQLHPHQIQAIELLGTIAAQTQRMPQAVDLLGRVVMARPNDPFAHTNYASALSLLGRFDESLQSSDRALQVKPDHAEAHSNRGAALQALGRLGEALQSLDRALQIKPDLVEAHSNRGNVLQALGRFDDALRSYECALQIKPNYAEAYSNRGNVLQALGRFDEALLSYERALHVRPHYAEAHNNSGNALQALGRFDEALLSYERALHVKPHYAEAHSNRGNALQALGRLDEALLSYNRAISLEPNFLLAYKNRAYAELLAGNFADGWLDHEWRWKGMTEARFAHETRWRGRESLIGKTIVLHSEQGLGDALQFSRYVKQVADLGATVILEVPSQLAALLGNLPGLSQLVVRGEQLPAFDYHCPLMSLPLAFRTSLSTIPAQVPYIVSDSIKRRFWMEHLGVRTKPRVGLVWSGGFRPDQPEVWPVNSRRNVPLAKLSVLRNPDIDFYSLQKGEQAESELAELKATGWQGPELIDFTHALHDFSDTAALVENLDLVISVDTSVAHLAGALAKPVWIMNRFDTCWRWLLNRADSPWYPTARLYRQQRVGDWDEVIERIRMDLYKAKLNRRV
jgi:tetratricopeptide (TPR) repeat protein